MIFIIERRESDIARLVECAVDPASLANDGASYCGVRVEKPWGHEHELFSNPDCSVWRLCIKPHHVTSLHCHTGKTTMLTVESGRVSIQTLHGIYLLDAGHAALIERGTFHRTGSEGGQEAVVLETEWPPNRRDLVRLQDRYGRAGKPYAG